MRLPGFIGPSYELQSKNFDAQRCVNLFPEINQLGTGKHGEVASLVSTPGLKLRLTLATSPVRGVYTSRGAGVLYVVSGNKLYSIDSSWIATERGTLNSDTGPVSMSDNGVELIMVDGTDGYTFNFSSTTFAEITDVDFQSADVVTFQDGYFILNYTGTAQFFISGLLDGTTYDAADFATAEGSPDNLIGLISNGQNLFLFGSDSIEGYYNSGNVDFPFERIQGTVINKGCSAAQSIKNVDNMVYWLGGDKDGSGTVYRMAGYQPERISTPSIENQIRKASSTSIEAARAWSYQQGGHHFYCLNVPTLNTTWCYDTSTGMWHERQFKGDFFDERHRAEDHAVAYGENVVGDYNDGRIYTLDMDTFLDDTTAIVRLRQSPHVAKNSNRLFMKEFQLDMETGVGLDGTTQGDDPQAMLQISKDGGHKFGTEIWRSIGKIGEKRQRVIWRRLGSGFDFVFRVMISDPVKVVLIGAEIEIEEGVNT